MKKQEQDHQKENLIYQEYQLILNEYNEGKAKLGIELLINIFNVYCEHKQETTVLTKALERYSQNAESDLEKLICYEMLSILRKTPELLSDKILPTLESFLDKYSGQLMDIDLQPLEKYFQSIKNRDSSLYDKVIEFQNKITVIPFSIPSKQSEITSYHIAQLAMLVKEYEHTIEENISALSSKHKNHLILIPKYKTGNKCQNIFQWYDENGTLKEGKLTDDPFDLVYYVAWLDQSKKKNLYFSKNVMDEHIIEIMCEKHPVGPQARFNSNWAKDDNDGRLKGQRMSYINKKIGTEIIARPETSLIINKNITVDLQPFPQNVDKI